MEKLFAEISSFIFVTLAAKQLGEYLTRFKLPLISGYLLAGIIAGPFILDFIHAKTVTDLHFIDEISLAFIAFAAGSELYLPELRNRLKSIGWNIVSQVSIIFALGSIVVFLLGDLIPFMKDMDTAGRGAAAILVGAIMVARSPSSAIAIVNELRAKGTFTKTILGVTIAMDVVVVIVFAISTSVADILLMEEGFNVGFIALLIVEITASFLLGYIIGRILDFILWVNLPAQAKIVFMLLVGYLIFFSVLQFRDYTHEHWSFEVLLEPLLICMVGGFWVTNYSPRRAEFFKLVEEAGPYVYVIFFTLVGDALELDVLADTWHIALLLVFTRVVGIVIGSFLGGLAAGDSMQHNRLSGMTYLTQAGIGLALAKEVASEFPAMGDEFATIMISAIVMTQFFGPPFFKIAIKRAGEAHLPGIPEPDLDRNVLILGISATSIALARQLQAHNWAVAVAGMDRTEFETFNDDEIDLFLIPEINAEVMCDLMNKATDAVVMMLEDDADSYRACEVACEEYGIPRLVVRLNDYSWADRFVELGAKVIYPATAVVNLLDQYVRAPQSADIFMHTRGHEVTQITVTDEDIGGVPLRKLRLPADVLVLGIVRDGTSIVPHGYTVLHIGDDVTIVGEPTSLQEVTLRLGY